MQKKVVFSLIVFIAVSIMLTFSVSAATPGVPEYIANWNGEEYFFANGAAIVVEAVEGQPMQALVKWIEGSVEKTQILGAGSTTGNLTHIFGGMHNDDTEINSSITINGGFVSWIHGGGLHRSKTATSTIVMNGGQVGMIKGGGADSWIGASTCGCSEAAFTPGNYSDAPCQVGTATVTVNGGIISNPNGSSSVYGGGNGHANTNVATVIINGGDLTAATVTGGGSHGNTNTANVAINGTDAGKAIKVVQTVNRGVVNNVSLKVTGGEIQNLYVGGEKAADVNAIIQNSLVAEISGNAKVSTMSLGYNGGLAIDSTDQNSVVKSGNIKVLASVVENFDGTLADDVTSMYTVKIDGTAFSVEAGKDITTISGYNNLIKKDGYTFKGFKNGNDDYDVTKAVTSNITLVTAWEKVANVDTNNQQTTSTPALAAPAAPTVAQDNTPKTGVVDLSLYIAAIIGTVAFIGIVAIKKSSK